MTLTIYRDLAYLGAAKQSAQGSGEAPTRFFKLRKHTFLADQQIGDFRNGNVQDIGYSVKESYRYAGSFQTHLYADEGGALLAWIMGTDTKTGAGDPYTHTLALADTLPYVTFEMGRFENQILERVIDCKLGRAEVSFEAAKEILLDVDLIGGNASIPSAATVTFNDAVDQGPMVMHQGAFTIVGPSDAANFQAQIEKGSIILDRGISAEFGPGSLTPIGVAEQARMVTVKLTGRFSGPTFYKLVHFGAVGGTVPSAVVGQGSLEVTFTSQAAAPGPERSILLTCGYLNWKIAKPVTNADAKVGRIEIEAVGYRSGANLPLTAVVKNGISTAYV